MAGTISSRSSRTRARWRYGAASGAPRTPDRRSRSGSLTSGGSPATWWSSATRTSTRRRSEPAPGGQGLLVGAGEGSAGRRDDAAGEIGVGHPRVEGEHRAADAVVAEPDQVLVDAARC